MRKEVIFKKQRLYKRLRVLSCNCLGDRCGWCYLWRMQEACRRALINWMVYFYRVIAISSYRWSFEVLTFLWAFFRAPSILLLQRTSILAKKLKFTKVYVLFHKFYYANHNRRGRLSKLKNGFFWQNEKFKVRS